MTQRAAFFDSAEIAKSCFTVGLLIAVLSMAASVAAQTFRGTILGTVTDPQGAAVPDATVTAKNLGTGLERRTVTDAAGNFS